MSSKSARSNSPTIFSKLPMRLLFGRSRIALGAPSGSNFAKAAPPSRQFWVSLGVDYAAIDLGGHRDSVALDLNNDEVPTALIGQFDLVVNSGTSEHIANQAQTFRIIHDLTKLGGLMYHEVPAGSWDHGLFNYTPKFFLLLHKQNDYQQIHLRERNDQDMTIRIALRKRVLRPFVTPLDVPPELMPRKYRQPWRTFRRLARLP